MQCTEDDHLDKQDLIKAKVLMSDVAASINESKRRKDIGELRIDNPVVLGQLGIEICLFQSTNTGQKRTRP